jgi:hypothetical protein
MSKRRRKSKGPFVALPVAIMRTPAWVAMSPEGRLLWMKLRSRLRNDGLNNGKLFRSCRDAAEALGLNKDTVARRFAENEHYGFLRKTSEGFLGSDGRGIAACYRFTDLAYGTHAASRDYEKWDGSIFELTPSRPSRRKQNPVLPRRTPCPTASDIRGKENVGGVCLAASDTVAAPRCPTASDTSRIPSIGLSERGPDQGSSTARAPGQAGGAGSSPAPDTNPAFTEWLHPKGRDLPNPQPFSTVSKTMNGVLHAAVPGDVPPDSTQIFIRFDTRDADLAERFMARAIGKPFLRSVRAPGFYLSKSEFDSVLELAATEGAISLHERLSPTAEQSHNV